MTVKTEQETLVTGASSAYEHAPTEIINVGGVEFAYRQLGPRTGVPVVFLTHLAAVLDNWDPRVVDGIAARHRVITWLLRVGPRSVLLWSRRDAGRRIKPR